MRRWGGKLIYYLLGPLVIGWVIRNSRRSRVLVMIDDEILLVRSAVSSQRWDLPGGGIKRGEEAANGAGRELQEETSVVVDPSQLQQLGSARQVSVGQPYRAMYFYARLKQKPKITLSHEILDYAWCKTTALPKPLHDNVTKALQLLQSKT